MLEAVITAAITLITGLITLGFTYLRKKWINDLENGEYRKAFLLLEAGVNETWEKVGKELKAKAADGKFTSDEREQLRDFAYAEAKRLGVDAGLDISKVIAPKVAAAIIRSIIEGRKRDKSLNS